MDEQPAPTRLLCMRCGGEFVAHESLRACPGCGDSEGVPADLDDTVTITLTRHELRILTIWATNYAHEIDMPQVTTTITDRLAQFTDAPLSMAQEFTDLASAFGQDNVKSKGIPGVPDTLDDGGALRRGFRLRQRMHRLTKEHHMGVLTITTRGSFPTDRRDFSAMERGHAHAVAQAIRFLSEEVLPEAIERDHRLHDDGVYPSEGFDRP